ncbi:hypothetical protein [Allorhizobium taibaishanense]|uniref:Uncharacterized protein n=1 Tax=Allorhizobium taibaishanense TaxID=887144 RepID=A0A7W6HIZ2_9HYPH|nr:hypothetical protein [Allorhizobium taibaishanense]MBB4006104.1 hypothetical protein [Allorhizobium taibaishanense]
MAALVADRNIGGTATNIDIKHKQLAVNVIGNNVSLGNNRYVQGSAECCRTPGIGAGFHPTRPLQQRGIRLKKDFKDDKRSFQPDAYDAIHDGPHAASAD